MAPRLVLGGAEMFAIRQRLYFCAGPKARRACCVQHRQHPESVINEVLVSWKTADDRVEVLQAAEAAARALASAEELLQMLSEK